MKNIYNTLGMTKACLCALAISLVTTGCSDLLDKEPPSAISDGSFWTGEGDAMLALTGCYRFQTGWSHDDFATPQGLLYLDFAGGNGTEKENFSTLMASSNTVATNGNLRWYWGNAERFPAYNAPWQSHGFLHGCEAFQVHVGLLVSFIQLFRSTRKACSSCSHLQAAF